MIFLFSLCCCPFHWLWDIFESKSALVLNVIIRIILIIFMNIFFKSNGNIRHVIDQLILKRHSIGAHMILLFNTIIVSQHLDGFEYREFIRMSISYWTLIHVVLIFVCNLYCTVCEIGCLITSLWYFYSQSRCSILEYLRRRKIIVPVCVSSMNICSN